MSRTSAAPHRVSLRLALQFWPDAVQFREGQAMRSRGSYLLTDTLAWRAHSRCCQVGGHALSFMRWPDAHCGMSSAQPAMMVRRCNPRIEYRQLAFHKRS
jgi:hypothetical protein